MLKSEILKSNGCNIKRGKSVISSEVEENQGTVHNLFCFFWYLTVFTSFAGVIRRKIVNSSFQSQRLSRRLPGSGRSDESARRALLSRSPNS